MSAQAALKTAPPPLEPTPGALELIRLLKVSEDLVVSLRGFFTGLDRSLHSEIHAIGEYIAKAREEIMALRPNDLSRERIPSAGAELDAIVKDTEAATIQIMNAAELVMGADNADPDAYKALVDEQMMAVFEACSFQDITGQRVSKVVGVLRHIEDRVSRLANTLGVADLQVEETAEEKRKRELMLNGPALDGPETGQDDIDALFANDTTSSQDDIDALFD